MVHSGQRHHGNPMTLSPLVSKILPHTPRWLTIAGIALTAQLFAGSSFASPACHKTAVCLMQKAAKKPVEARTAHPEAPCNHKTAVCKRVSMEAKPRQARSPKASPATSLCSHKTAVCLRVQQEQKAKAAQAKN
jgi:hypothetical protein